MIMNRKALLSVLVGIPLSGVITFGVWALDTRYVTISDLQQYQQEQQKQKLGDRIDELTLKKNLGLADDFDKALLEQLKEKLNRQQ
jgi:hypothetical protein